MVKKQNCNEILNPGPVQRKHYFKNAITLMILLQLQFEPSFARSIDSSAA